MKGEKVGNTYSSKKSLESSSDMKSSTINNEANRSRKDTSKNNSVRDSAHDSFKFRDGSSTSTTNGGDHLALDQSSQKGFVSVLNSLLASFLLVFFFYNFSLIFSNKLFSEQESHFAKALKLSSTEQFFETKSQEISKTFAKLWLADDFKSLKDFSSDLRLNSDISALKHFEMPLYFNLTHLIHKGTGLSLRNISLLYGVAFLLLSFYLSLRLSVSSRLISCATLLTLSSTLYSLGLGTSISSAVLFCTLSVISFIFLDSLINNNLMSNNSLKENIKPESSELNESTLLKTICLSFFLALTFLSSSLFPIIAIAIFFPLKALVKEFSEKNSNASLWAGLIFVFSLIVIWPAGILKAKLILTYYINYLSSVPSLENSRFITSSLLLKNPLLFASYFIFGIFGLIAIFTKTKQSKMKLVLTYTSILALLFMFSLNIRNENIFLLLTLCVCLLGTAGISLIPMGKYYNLRFSVPLIISLLALSNAYQQSPEWQRKISEENEALNLINSVISKDSNKISGSLTNTLLIGEPLYLSNQVIDGNLTHLPSQVKRSSEIEIFTHTANPDHIILMKSHETSFLEKYIKSLLKLGFTIKLDHKDFFLYSKANE